MPAFAIAAAAWSWVEKMLQLDHCTWKTTQVLFAEQSSEIGTLFRHKREQEQKSTLVQIPAFLNSSVKVNRKTKYLTRTGRIMPPQRIAELQLCHVFSHLFIRESLCQTPKEYVQLQIFRKSTVWWVQKVCITEVEIFRTATWQVSSKGYGHAAIHQEALKKVRNTAEMLHAINRHSHEIMLKQLPLCSPVMEAFPAELSTSHGFHN